MGSLVRPASRFPAPTAPLRQRRTASAFPSRSAHPAPGRSAPRCPSRNARRQEDSAALAEDSVVALGVEMAHMVVSGPKKQHRLLALTRLLLFFSTNLLLDSNFRH